MCKITVLHIMCKFACLRKHDYFIRYVPTKDDAMDNAITIWLFYQERYWQRRGRGGFSAVMLRLVGCILLLTK